MQESTTELEARERISMKEQPELTITEHKTSELVPYANNAKIHTNEQIEQIVKSIEEFGFNDPIAIWHNPNNELEIVEGHGRVLAAQKMGLEIVPTISLDHLDDVARRAYIHVHNQLTMNTGWDFSVLDCELEALGDAFNFEDFGFDSGFDCIDDLLNEEFASTKSDLDIFSLTFTFPISEKDKIDEYIKQNGKESIVNIIIEEVKQWV